MLDTIAALEYFFRDDADVYVSGNMMFYYKQMPRPPHPSIAPDVFVVKGVTKHERRVYKLWEEGHAPAVIFEITSESTRKDDLEDKKLLYAEMGVLEYFLFDPLAEYLKPPLQGFRLRRGQYYSIKPDVEGALLSYELTLKLRWEEKRLRLIDTLTDEPLLTPLEGFARVRDEAEAREAAEERARVAEQRAQYEAAARQAAEAELERVRAELARLRGEQSN
jgi:Uma2 family endonuclease